MAEKSKGLGGTNPPARPGEVVGALPGEGEGGAPPCSGAAAAEVVDVENVSLDFDDSWFSAFSSTKKKSMRDIM